MGALDPLRGPSILARRSAPDPLADMLNTLASSPLRKRVPVVWLAACLGASVPAVLGVLLRISIALGQDVLAWRLYELIAQCSCIPYGLLLSESTGSFHLSPAQLFLAAIACDAAVAALAFTVLRSCFRFVRRLMSSYLVRHVG